MLYTKKMNFKNLFKVAGVALAISMFFSCANDTVQIPTETVSFKSDVINVNYTNSNKYIFYDFSSGTKYELDHDFFDIAINA